jgi:hypothetical protein
MPFRSAEQLARLSDPNGTEVQRDHSLGQQRPGYAEIIERADAVRAYQADPTGAADADGGLLSIFLRKPQD